MFVMNALSVSARDESTARRETRPTPCCWPVVRHLSGSLASGTASGSLTAVGPQHARNNHRLSSLASYRREVNSLIVYHGELSIEKKRWHRVVLLCPVSFHIFKNLGGMKKG